MFDIVIRRGDTLPKIQKTLYVNGAPQNLTGYGVKFVVTTIDGVQIINNDATLADAVNGVVAYQWTTQDTTAFVDNIGFARFVATKASDVFTVPNNSPLTILLTSTTVSEYSYSGDPNARPIDQVRFLLGDVDMSTAKFTDSEILFMLTEYDNPYAAASELALTFAARYVDLRDKTVGPLSIRYGDVLSRWDALAKSLKRRAGAKSGLTVITTQTTRAKPIFTIGQNDFPQSVLFDWQAVANNP